MTDEKILEVLERYDVYLKLINEDQEPQYNHMRQMIPKMRVFLEEGRREKLMRWLGFIQGALWYDGRFTVEQLAEHNRDEE